MRHEDKSQMQPGLQFEQQVQDLRLHRDIKRGDRFIRNHQAGTGRERARNADALALTSAEGMWETVHELRPEPDQPQQFGDALAAASDAVDQKRFADIVEQCHARIERAERILEDHLYLAPERLELRAGHRGQIDHLPYAGMIQNLTGRRLDRAQDRTRYGRLAAARFTDEPERFALSYDETHIIDRPHMADHTPEEAPGDREVLPQPPDVEQRRRISPGHAVHAGSAGS